MERIWQDGLGIHHHVQFRDIPDEKHQYEEYEHGDAQKDTPMRDVVFVHEL